MIQTLPLRTAQLNPAYLFTDLLPSELKRRAKQFFVYSVEFLPLGASATATQTFVSQGDSAFIAVGATGQSRDTGTGAAQADRPFTMAMLSSGSGRQLQDRAQDFDNIVGTAQLPSIWPAPYILAPSSTFSVTLTNLIATARNVRISFVGFKVFNTDMGQ